MGRKSETAKNLEKAVRADTDRGVAACDLPDHDLHRELVHLYETREDTFFDGSPQALREHTRRMLELEHEYTLRHADQTAPSPDRTREGTRRRAGQDPTAKSTRRRPKAS